MASISSLPPSGVTIIYDGEEIIPISWKVNVFFEEMDLGEYLPRSHISHFHFKLVPKRDFCLGNQGYLYHDSQVHYYPYVVSECRVDVSYLSSMVQFYLDVYCHQEPFHLPRRPEVKAFFLAASLKGPGELLYLADWLIENGYEETGTQLQTRLGSLQAI